MVPLVLGFRIEIFQILSKNDVLIGSKDLYEDKN